MSEEPHVQQEIQLIAIDDPRDIQWVKCFNGKTLFVPDVVSLIKKGRRFGVADPKTGQLTAVTYVDDNTIKTIGDDTTSNNLKSLPVFDPYST
jgi:hypothetical protein